MNISLNYQWTIEGDLQAEAWLNLFFDVRLRHHEVESITLLKDDTNLEGVTFCRNKSEIICDGENGPDLPDPLWLWFIDRFHEAYENIEAIKSGLLDEVAERAVQESYES